MNLGDIADGTVRAGVVAAVSTLATETLIHPKFVGALRALIFAIAAAVVIRALGKTAKDLAPLFVPLFEAKCASERHEPSEVPRNHPSTFAESRLLDREPKRRERKTNI